MDALNTYWPVILIAVVVVAIILFLVLRPRQRVQLSQDAAPVRPHMQAKERHEGRGIAAEAAAAATDVTGQIINAPVHENLPGASGPPDNLVLLKGVGPKFAEALHGAGFVNFAQLANLTQVEVERLDKQLGAFAGRITRDRVVEQADYLSRNDTDGFEQRFGKL